MPLTPITDWCSHYAIFYDSQGHYVGRKKLDFAQPTFTFLHRGYNFIPLKSSFFKVQHVFNSTKYYFYSLDNPNPLLIKNKLETPVLTSEEFGVLLETDVIKKLNDLSKKNWLLELLTPTNLIILAVVIGLVYWFSTKGSPA